MTSDDLIITDHTKDKTTGYLFDVKHDPDAQPSSVRETLPQNIPDDVEDKLNEDDDNKSDTGSANSYLADPQKYSLTKLESASKLSHNICAQGADTFIGVSLSKRKRLAIPIPIPRSIFDLSLDGGEHFDHLASIPEKERVQMNGHSLRPSVNFMVNIGRGLITNQFSNIIGDVDPFKPLNGIHDNPQKAFVDIPKKKDFSYEEIFPEKVYTRHLNWKLKSNKTANPNPTVQKYLSYCENNRCVYNFTSSLLLARHIQMGHLKSYKLDSHYKSKNFVRRPTSIDKMALRLPLPILKNLACMICQKSFTRFFKLQEHYKKSHGLDYIGDEPVKQEVCTYCGNYKANGETSIPCYPRTSILNSYEHICEAGVAADPSRGLDGHALAMLLLTPNPGANFYFPSKEVQYTIDKFVHNYIKESILTDSFSIPQRYSISVSSFYGTFVDLSKEKSVNQIMVKQVSWLKNTDAPIEVRQMNQDVVVDSEKKIAPLERKRELVSENLSTLNVVKKKPLYDPQINRNCINQLLSTSHFYASPARTPCEFCTNYEHKLILLNDNQEFRCPKCALTSDCISRLVIHLNVCHNTFISLNEIAHNIFTVGEKRPFNQNRVNDMVCEFCSFVTDDSNTYLNHIHKDHSDALDHDTIVCIFCQMTCRTRTGHRSHLKVTCPLCESVSDCFTKLMAHVYLVHKRFYSVTEIRKMVMNISKNPNRCNACSINFTREEFLKRHLEQVHGSSKPRIKACDYCKILFQDEKSYAEHVHVSCPMCNVASQCYTQLKNHVEVSHKAFFTPDELRNLIRAKNTEDPKIAGNQRVKTLNHFKRLLATKSIRKMGIFECFGCAQSLKGWKSFNEHQIKMHSKIGKKVTITCPKCRMATEDSIDLLAHLKLNHNLNTLNRLAEGEMNSENQPHNPAMPIPTQTNPQSTLQSVPTYATTNSIGSMGQGINIVSLQQNKPSQQQSQQQQTSTVTSQQAQLAQLSQQSLQQDRFLPISPNKRNNGQGKNANQIIYPKAAAAQNGQLKMPLPGFVQNEIQPRPNNNNGVPQYILTNQNFQMPRFIITQKNQQNIYQTNQFLPQIIQTHNGQNIVQIDPSKLQTSTNQLQSSHLLPSQQPNTSASSGHMNIVPITFTSIAGRPQILRPMNKNSGPQTHQGAQQHNFVLQIPSNQLSNGFSSQTNPNNALTTPITSTLNQPNINQHASGQKEPDVNGQNQFQKAIVGHNNPANSSEPMELDKAPIKNNPVQMIICRECKITFYFRTTYEEHVSWSHYLSKTEVIHDYTMPRNSFTEFPLKPTTVTYLCTKCSVEFHNLESLIIHRRYQCEHRMFINKENCEICSTTQTSKMTLMHHMMKKHSKDLNPFCQPVKSWRCVQCAEDFYLQDTLIKHLYNICPYCLHWFPCFSFLYSHVFLMHSRNVEEKVLMKAMNKVYDMDIRVFKCLNCDLKIGNLTLLRNHLYRDHPYNCMKGGANNESRQGIQCPSCDHFIDNEREYVYHNFANHNKRADSIPTYGNTDKNRLAPSTEIYEDLTRSPDCPSSNEKENNQPSTQMALSQKLVVQSHEGLNSSEKATLPTLSSSVEAKGASNNNAPSTTSTAVRSSSKRKSQPKKLPTTDYIVAAEESIPNSSIDLNGEVASRQNDSKDSVNPEAKSASRDNEGEGYVTCPLCEFSSTSREEIMDHLESHH